jgi:hypothetical protein
MSAEILDRAAILNLEAIRASGLSLNDYITAMRRGIKRQAIAQEKNKTRAARVLKIHRNIITRGVRSLAGDSAGEVKQ